MEEKKMFEKETLDVINNMNAEIQKELFMGLERVGVKVYFEHHNVGTGLQTVLVIKNMKLPEWIYNASIDFRMENVDVLYKDDFEKDFPNLILFPRFKKLITRPKGEIPSKTSMNVFSNSEINTDYTINEEEIIQIPILDIQKYCFDKSKEIYISEEEMHELIIKGRIETKKGFKINASFPADYGNLLRFIKTEHFLLEEYKAKAREAIRKRINQYKYDIDVTVEMGLCRIWEDLKLEE
jgi:hypothetical protein